jgi:hypothetical protein
MADEQQSQALWVQALQDAGYSPRDAILVLIQAATRAGEPEVGYFGPDADSSTSPLVLTPREAALIDAAPDKHRVALSPQQDPQVQLGLMRWALERARQTDENGLYWFLGEAINSAIQPIYGDTGMGSNVVWHTIPVARDADSAAGHLVTSTFGPQFGDLWGPQGALFRTDQPVPDLSTLPRRLVTFGAIHAESLEQWVRQTQRELALNTVLRDIDPQAPAWWKALLADEDFTHLRKSATYYIPTPDTIAEAGANAANAWRPLQRHYDITLQRGLDVLVSRFGA